jgi:hypothetical protein
MGRRLLMCSHAGWTLYDTKCYQINSVARSWPQALAICARYGAQLARVESGRENEVLASLARAQLRTATTDSMWLGMCG